MKKWIFITLLITLGLYASYSGLRPPGIFIHESERSSELNFYLVGLEARSFDKTGRLAQILLTEKASQETSQDEIRLDKLQLQAGSENNLWHVTADSGTTFATLDRMTLESNVKLSNADGNMEIDTEMLVFDGKKEIAYSDSPIRIRAKGSETSATGVHVDFKEETIQLKHNVKTYYDPKLNNPDGARSGG